MKITQVTVSYGETQSLPEYSNVKPALTLTATIDPYDDPAVAEAALWELARQSVHAQIDAALEANGRAAKYDPAPRYQVLMTYWDRYGRPRDTPEPPKIVVILPNSVELERGPDVYFVSPNHLDTRKLRYAHALRIATEAAQERGYTLLDCADGDLSRLLAALPVVEPPEPLSEEDAAGIRDADDREDDRAEDEELSGGQVDQRESELAPADETEGHPF